MKRQFLVCLLLIPLFLYSGNRGKSHSVLSSGHWYKIATTHNGIYHITYDNFVAMGFDPAAISTSNIMVFGNGAGMLPENNSVPRTDDLTEIPLEMIDGNDGKLDPGDYLIFYGEGPDKWNYDKEKDNLVHEKNLYSDSVYYFVTVGTVPGKRVGIRESLTISPDYYVNRFRDYDIHELDSTNLIRSGKTWVGEHFNSDQFYEFPFDLDNLDTTVLIKVRLHLLARATLPSGYNVSDGYSLNSYVPIPSLDTMQLDDFICRDELKTVGIYQPRTKFTLKIEYDPQSAQSEGWLDYFQLNFTRKMIWNGPQMSFRDPFSIGKNCTEFRLRETEPDVTIWDVTCRDDVRRMISAVTDSTIRFRISTDSLREFIAFDRSFFYDVIPVGPVANQDLHGLAPCDMIILTHPSLTAEAEKLAEFRRNHDGFSVSVVNVKDVYNEFGCGMEDPSSIRDFVKLMYDRSDSLYPKYLLLFGDGSYDPRYRLPGNNNLIPTFQSRESFGYGYTFLCEDFYGLMNAGEGSDADGSVDVSVGRLPVTTPEEAGIMVDKIIRYSSGDSVFGDWRNRFTLLADDENQNTHFHQSEMLTELVERDYPFINVEKIYNDAYKMVPTPTGERLPQVNEAISEAVARGTLLVNYFGHGGEEGLAAEKILTKADIQEWNNNDKLPVFITATCEFSRFDNPERYTAGELMVSRSGGGAVALLSTTRLSFSLSNFSLDTSFFKKLITTDGSPMPRLGDAVRLAKNEQGNSEQLKNFVLLGDPAMQLAIPYNKVVTTEIQSEGAVTDTLTGLSEITVSGKIQNPVGGDISINGKLMVTVFDKPVLNHTIGNHPPQSYSEPFYSLSSVIFKGSCTVTDGKFSFNFLVPKSINPYFGNGKISYYFKGENTDGGGYDGSPVIGGQNEFIDPSGAGPEIDLYMDDLSFISGGRTDPNATLIARISDDQGVNTIGLGIGHDLTAVLDEDAAHTYFVNDLFVFDEGSWKSGGFDLPFVAMSPGKHTLTVRAWDMYNNASTKDIVFWVSNEPQGVADEVYSYPDPFDNRVTNTTLVVRNNGKSIPGTLSVRIYSSMGALVRTIERNFPDGVPAVVKIPWDGTGENGEKISPGLYILRTNFPPDDGYPRETSGKVMIFNR